MNETWKAYIGEMPIKLRVLTTPLEHSIGFQYQDTVPTPGEGLLFLFQSEKSRNFHMKNVNFDLDLLGFDCAGKLICKIPMRSNAKVSYSTPKCKFIIEVPKGWATNLKPGEACLRVIDFNC